MSRIDALLDIMAQLRNPDGGCPWDLAQTFATIAPYTIEEAYEVADAIERDDLAALKDELGDLLFQVVFHARLAEEQGAFTFDDVVAAINAKMVRRHPHVFGGAAPAADAAAQLADWERIKQQERAADPDGSALAGIARGLPEWQRATKLQKRAARVGFDWPDADPVFAKLHEELDEVRAELAQRGTPAFSQTRLEDEIGDVLFVCINLARHANVDPGVALRRANAKFERRFRRMETLAAAEGGLAGRDLVAQEALWDTVKREEHG